MDRRYDVAQICIHGHVVNLKAASAQQNNSNICGECGAPTVLQCYYCRTPIKGYLHGEANEDYTPPRVCHSCGKPYPWGK